MGVIGFYWVHGIAEPMARDPFWVRIVISSAALGIFFASYWVTPKVMVRLGYGAFYLITFWTLWLLLVNDLSENWALGLLVVAAGIAAAFQDRRSLVTYQLATLVGAGLAAWWVADPRVDLVVFFTYAIMMAALSYTTVSVRLELDRRRAESEERYALAAYGANDGLWDWDLGLGVVHYSPRWKAMIGHPDAEIGDSPEEWFTRIHPEDRDRARTELTASGEGDPHRWSEYRMRHADGSWRWMLARGAVVRDEHGNTTRIAGSQADITQRKQAEQKLAHDALHDPLTDLPNRTLLMDRLERLLVVSRRRPHNQFAVIFLDLDRFKRVNDSLGHASGDQLLIEVGQRLRSHLREEDTLARLGGDEFAIILPRVEDGDDAVRAAQRIAACLDEPVDAGGQTVFVTSSMGIALGPGRYETPGQIVRDADIAMYRCKKERLGRPQIFDETMHRQVVNQLRIELELRQALQRNELVLHYQPIVGLGSRRLDGLEALVRWQHPERGLLPPGQFLPVAEEGGLIVDLGRWALREACAAGERWRRSLGAPVPVVHVNLSGTHFLTGSVLPDVMAALEPDISGAALAIEITENVLLDDPRSAAGVLTELRSHGVEIAIDDFGTGYSSLRYLHSLPADTLKIDRSFIQDMDKRRGEDLVRTVVVLADRLGLSTVAEGVETQEMERRVAAAGVSHAQGFLYAPALPESEARDLLSRKVAFPA